MNYGISWFPLAKKWRVFFLASNCKAAAHVQLHTNQKMMAADTGRHGLAQFPPTVTLVTVASINIHPDGEATMWGRQGWRIGKFSLGTYMIRWAFTLSTPLFGRGVRRPISLQRKSDKEMANDGWAATSKKKSSYPPKLDFGWLVFATTRSGQLHLEAAAYHVFYFCSAL